MNVRFLKAVALKEFRHIWRDGQTLFIIISLPVIMMFLFGYALKSEIENARVVLIDPSPCSKSALLAEAIDVSTQFKLVATVQGGDPSRLMVENRAQVVLHINPDYAWSLENLPVKISAWFDGSDPAMATTLQNSLPGFLRSHLSYIMGIKFPEPLKINTRFLFNSEQKSSLFFVPGLMATILAMICALLTSVTVTKEKELGTLSNLRISKLSSSDIIVGKLLPYFLIAALTGVLILTIGYIVFDVSIQGSLLFLAFATSIYLLTNLGLGLLISTLVKKQQHAMLAALGITMMPTIMLSGFVFPIASLPMGLRIISKILPATWYLQIVRGIVLKAAGLTELSLHVAVLAFLGTVFIVLSAIRFSKET